MESTKCKSQRCSVALKKCYVMLYKRSETGWRHAPLPPWKVKFWRINGLLTIKRRRRENNRHNSYESVQEINTLVELLH